MFQKGGSSRSNRLRLLPFDKVEHALRRALLRYAQIAQLATHARYLHALQCTRGFVIPKTTGFGFSKRWVSFHKTTPILFEGFSHPFFFALGSESAPGSESALLFVSLLCFARSCCFFACFSTFWWLDSTFFLIMFGGGCFVCIFAVENEPWFYMGID